MNKDEINNKLDEIINTAASRINARQYDEAESILKSGEEIDGSNPELLYNLAVLYLKQDRYTEGINYLQKIRELPFTSVDIVQVEQLLCYSYFSLESYSSCGPLLIGLMNKLPNNSQILAMLGYYYEKIGKLDQAIETYQQIIKIDSSNLNAHNSFAYISALAEKDLNAALRSARLCIQKYPDNPAYCDTIGYVHLKRGESDMAKKYITKAVQLLPTSDIIRLHLNQLLDI